MTHLPVHPSVSRPADIIRSERRARPVRPARGTTTPPGCPMTKYLRPATQPKRPLHHCNCPAWLPRCSRSAPPQAVYRAETPIGRAQQSAASFNPASNRSRAEPVATPVTRDLFEPSSIPTRSTVDSERSRPPVPIQSGRQFHDPGTEPTEIVGGYVVRGTLYQKVVTLANMLRALPVCGVYVTGVG
jgi:hypothetical protein